MLAAGTTLLTLCLLGWEVGTFTLELLTEGEGTGQQPTFQLPEAATGLFKSVFFWTKNLCMLHTLIDKQTFWKIWLKN